MFSVLTPKLVTTQILKSLCCVSFWIKMNRLDKKLTIASASQNLDTKSEKVVHRFIPMLVAENMTRVSEYESGKAVPRVDLWNCIGMRMDKAFQNQREHSSRMDFSSALLKDKYAMLEELGVPREGRDVIRDDDDSTKTWLKHRIKQLVSSGTVYVEPTMVNICDDCGYLQSVQGSPTSSCTLCEGKDFHHEKKEVLMIDIPENRNSLTKGRIIHPRNSKHIQSFFEQMPPKMMISKVREYGLPLDPIGLPEYVLDPKIGVALMPELVTERNGLSEVTLVQGAAVAINALPYTSIMTSGFQHTYVLLPKIPPTTLEDARNIGLSFMGRHLPFILMEHNGDLTPAQFKTAQEEYSRIMWKIDKTLFELRSEKRGMPVDLRLEDHQMLSEIARDFDRYDIRDGRRKLNRFFKNQGRKCAEELRKNGDYLSPKDVDTLEGVVKLFYRV